MAGRPAKYTKPIGDRICARIAAGHSITRICKDTSMPSRATVYRWLRAYDEFLEGYQLAKEDAADLHAEQILEIADSLKRKEHVDNTDVQIARLRIDSRKWTAMKLKPKLYGDRVHNEVTGADGGAVAVTAKVLYLPDDGSIDAVTSDDRETST